MEDREGSAGPAADGGGAIREVFTEKRVFEIGFER